MRLGLTLKRRPGMVERCKERAGKARDRFSNLMLLLVANALSIAILALAIIGAPPRWRIDVLWVNSHENMVRVIIIALAVAAGASTMVMPWRRPRGLMLSLWLLATGAAVAFFWDQLQIIASVLMRHHL